MAVAVCAPLRGAARCRGSRPTTACARLNKGEGDSVVIGTSRAASDALAAAVGRSWRCGREGWPEGVRLGVRMAIRTGEDRAPRRGGNYFGPTVIRSARLRALVPAARCWCRAPPRDLVGDGLLPARRSRRPRASPAEGSRPTGARVRGPPLRDARQRAAALSTDNDTQQSAGAADELRRSRAGARDAGSCCTTSSDCSRSPGRGLREEAPRRAARGRTRRWRIRRRVATSSSRGSSIPRVSRRLIRRRLGERERRGRTGGGDRDPRRQSARRWSCSTTASIV